MPFVLPQFGIFAQGTHAHHFLEFDLHAGVTKEEAVTSFRRLRAPEVSSGGINLVIAFRPSAWKEVAPSRAPSSLADFHEVVGPDGRRAPATQHDVFLWISGSAPDVTWDHARAATMAVGDVAKLAAEQPAFTYRDNRDMTGFIDGTANPPIRRAAEVALVPMGQPGEGGGHVLAMRWVHDLNAFNRLTVEEQELVYGRSKSDSVEMSDERKPLDAHIARASVVDDGGEAEIFRRSVPWGTVQEQGLYFLAFSADQSRFDRMLSRIFGTAGDGLHDHLTDFTHPVSGSYYFAPSLDALNDVAGPEQK
ncbi:MAG: Dyp-type peroxidase [Thaumarchaeota archaeon]|nr:Dyp-type peroxidase [Nitrososphaerota archaeon]